MSQSRRLVDRWFINGLSPRQWRTLRRSLGSSPEARAYYDKVAAARATLANDDGLDRSRIDAIRNDIFTTLDASRPRHRAWLVWVPVVATAMALLIVVPKVRDDGFQARGGETAKTAIRAMCVGGDDVHAMSSSQEPQAVKCAIADMLQLAYTVDQTHWARYVFLVGIDAERRPLWYFPNPDEGRSMAVRMGEQLLPDGIALAVNHEPGPLYVYALFSTEPLSVDTVGAWIAKAAFGDMPSAADLATPRLEVRRLLLELTP